MILKMQIVVARMKLEKKNTHDLIVIFDWIQNAFNIPTHPQEQTTLYCWYLVWPSKIKYVDWKHNDYRYRKMIFELR